MDTRFHCSHSARRSAKRATHRVLDCCDTLIRVLAANPDYGVAIPGFSGLRKMRLMVPDLKVGKSGGYRLIYRSEMVDEVWHLVFLKTYFKGDCEDLGRDEYRALLQESEVILSDTHAYDWTDGPAPG